jgi:pimeloyl-ACP methyl ester carboxylesterase
MPALLVHGVPDTARVWRRLLARLARPDVVTVSLPGFAAPAPPRFHPTKEGYVDWLLDEIAGHPEPVDLVGHDWGALLVLRAASLAPGRVRSWVAGGAPLDPDYVWHQAAQVWQTAGTGERVMERLKPRDLEAALTAAGVPPEDAVESAAAVDATMKACILALYRSAVEVGREWVDELGKITAPGLVLWGEQDPYAAPRFGARLAERTRARFVSFPGCSHWWQLERPDEAAAEIAALWASLAA